jgi:hypothetical protein
MESNKNYQYVLDLCKDIIINEYRPCELEVELKDRLYELVLKWENNKERAMHEGKEIGGLHALFLDLMRAVEKAYADEHRFRKRTKCQYLKMGLWTPLGKPGALGNWFLSMIS